MDGKKNLWVLVINWVGLLHRYIMFNVFNAVMKRRNMMGFSKTLAAQAHVYILRPT